MDEQPPRILERVMSVYNLMQGATTPGEFDAASHKLEIMLEKYGINLDDLINPEPPKEEAWFSYSTDNEHDILIQVIGMVTSQRKITNIDWRWTGDRKREKGFMLTKAQAVDANLLYDAYVKAFRKALRDFMADIKERKAMFADAFIQANKMFPDLDDDDDRAEPELTEERLKYLKRLMDMRKDINPTPDPRSAGYLEASK